MDIFCPDCLCLFCHCPLFRKIRTGRDKNMSSYVKKYFDYSKKILYSWICFCLCLGKDSPCRSKDKILTIMDYLILFNLKVNQHNSYPVLNSINISKVF